MNHKKGILRRIKGMTSLYADMPEELRLRLISAADSMLGVGDNDTWRGQMLTSSCEEAIGLYRMLRAPEEEIAAKVARRLGVFLDEGRRYFGEMGLRNIQAFPSWHSSTDGISDDERLADRYNLRAIRGWKLSVGDLDRFGIGNGYYTISLDDAFDMARDIGNQELVSEALMHMVLLGADEEAYKAAEKLKNDGMLLNLAMLSLSDFYFGRNNYHPNYVWDAIEALKRVQDYGKPEAERILWDLARELSSDTLLDEIVAESRNPAEAYSTYKDTLTDKALKALRATGRLVGKKAIDSAKTDYITEVSDQKVAAEIKRLADKGMHECDRADLEGIASALQAIGDIETLKIYGEELFEQRFDPKGFRPERFYHVARHFFKAAGDSKRVLEIMDAEINEGLADVGGLDYEITIVPLWAELGHTEGLKGIIALGKKALAMKDDEYSYWGNAMKMAKRALKGLPVREPDPFEEMFPDDDSTPGYVRRNLILEARMRESVERYAKETKPEEKLEWQAKAREELEKREGWNAYYCSLRAADRDGLIAAGDLMTSNGDGNNARTAYIAAGMLPDKRPRLEGGKAEIIGPGEA